MRAVSRYPSPSPAPPPALPAGPRFRRRPGLQLLPHRVHWRGRQAVYFVMLDVCPGVARRPQICLENSRSVARAFGGPPGAA